MEVTVSRGGWEIARGGSLQGGGGYSISRHVSTNKADLSMMDQVNILVEKEGQYLVVTL